MTAFTSRWADWKPSNSTEGRQDGGNSGVRGAASSTPETAIQRTDRTDKSPSVSFVSASPERFQPEIGCVADGGANVDGTREQAWFDGSDSPPGWGDATAAVAWFASWTPPAEPFQLKPGITILDPHRWRQSIAADIAQGPSGPRARYGALQDDLRRLHELFGEDTA